jgi:hypothetical protein
MTAQFLLEIEVNLPLHFQSIHELFIKFFEESNLCGLLVLPLSHLDNFLEVIFHYSEFTDDSLVLVAILS